MGPHPQRTLKISEAALILMDPLTLGYGSETSLDVLSFLNPYLQIVAKTANSHPYRRTSLLMSQQLIIKHNHFTILNL
jgi:hypothetical protein